MMQLVPLQSVPSQTLNIALGGQSVTLNIYQKSFGLFVDVLVNNAIVIAGVLCENANRIVRSAYLGFAGDFIFIDTQGSSDPISTGLGSQYQLAYLSTTDLAAFDMAA
jgi:hypothetical protein